MNTKTAAKTPLTIAREDAGFTQVTFAKELGVSQQAVSEWERGKYPRDAMKVRVAKLLGSDPYELFPLHDLAAS